MLASSAVTVSDSPRCSSSSLDENVKGALDGPFARDVPSCAGWVSRLEMSGLRSLLLISFGTVMRAVVVVDIRG